MCFEMPFFAVLHLYAFSYTDFIDKDHLYSGRLPFFYALRDALGLGDVLADSVDTVKGTGFSYRTFEPAQGPVHVGRAQDRRIKAGLRYAEGGSSKYWLPMPGPEEEAHGRQGLASAAARPIHQVRRYIEQRFDAHEAYAPLRDEQAKNVLHPDSFNGDFYDHYDYARWRRNGAAAAAGQADGEDDDAVDFGTPSADEDELYDESRKLEFGDYTYPVIDASKEEARRKMAEQEEQRSAQLRRKRKGKARSLYARYDEALSVDPDPDNDVGDGTGGTANEREESKRVQRHDDFAEAALKSDDAVDLLVEDKHAAEEEMIKNRRRGEPTNNTKRVYRKLYDDGGESQQVESSSHREAKETDSREDVSVTEVDDGKGHSDIVVEQLEQESRTRAPPSAFQDDHDPWSHSGVEK